MELGLPKEVGGFAESGNCWENGGNPGDQNGRIDRETVGIYGNCDFLEDLILLFFLQILVA